MSLSKWATRFTQERSPVREIMEYADPTYIQGLGLDPAEVISFAGGWVGHSAPEGLRKAYQWIVEDRGRFHDSGAYPPTIGTRACRGAIAEYERYLYDEEISPDQIAIGLGSTQLMYDLFRILLDKDDRILLLDPSYCNYPMQVAAGVGAHVMRFSVFDPQSWQYVAAERMDDLRKIIRIARPKVMLLVVPDNPTSQVLPDDFVVAAWEEMRNNGGWLVIDFAYKDMIFWDAPPDYFSWAPRDGFISVHSGSKWSRSLGRRFGWIEAPEDVIAALETAQGISILCPDMLHQMALTTYLREAMADNSLKNYVEDVKDVYWETAGHTVDAIRDVLGLPCLIPQGGLYTVMDVGMNGAQFVGKVLREAGVLFVPGWGFGHSLTRSVRVSYGPLVDQLDTITEGMMRVGNCVRG